MIFADINNIIQYSLTTIILIITIIWIIRKIKLMICKKSDRNSCCGCTLKDKCNKHN